MQRPLITFGNGAAQMSLARERAKWDNPARSPTKGQFDESRSTASGFWNRIYLYLAGRRTNLVHGR